MKICFLVGDYVPHQILSIKTLLENYNAQALAFHVGRYIEYVPNLDSFTSYQYKEFSKAKIVKIIEEFNPELVVTSGWMIPEYNWICKKVRKKNDIPVVAMSDTPWYGTWRQRINALISPFHIRKAFTHLWVAGIRQYDYARKLGFQNNQIIFNSLCGDVGVFSKINIEAKKMSYPKNFVYIGRFTEIKGLGNLIEAWRSIREKKGWTFTLIGQGSMKEELVNCGEFIVKDYMSQDELINELQHSGCFVLPSLREPWALVIHEAAIAGLPILCTETCGAASHFVIDEYNGYKIEDNSVEDLKNKLEIIMNISLDELRRMSSNSRRLSHHISPDIQIASLLQLLK